MNKKKFIIISVCIGIVSVLMILLRIKAPTVNIDNSLPQDGATNILGINPIYFHFATPVMPTIQSKISFSSDPKANFDIEWNQDNQTVKLTPTTELIKKTSYSIGVLYKNKVLYTLHFTTNPANQADLKEQARIQSQDDVVFGKAFNKIITDYPWYSQLPITTPTYTIYFDFEKSQFIITVVEQNNTEIVTQTAVDKISELLGHTATSKEYYVVTTK